MGCALAQFLEEPALKDIDVVVLMEITMANLLAIGNNVLISNYLEFYRLISYFRRYTRQKVGVAMGINNLLEVFNEKYYDNLDGGILESFGRLLKNAVKLYIYPMRMGAYNRYCLADPSSCPTPGLGISEHPLAMDVWINATNLQVKLHLRNRYAHLLENDFRREVNVRPDQGLWALPS